MTFVGLDPQAALDLVARFDRAVQDLEQHAQVIEGLFAQAGRDGVQGVRRVLLGRRIPAALPRDAMYDHGTATPPRVPETLRAAATIPR